MYVFFILFNFFRVRECIFKALKIVFKGKLYTEVLSVVII